MKQYVFILLSCINFIACSQNKTFNNADNMTDKEIILQNYKDMYSYMIAKDTVNLGKLMSDNFVLIHMTGMKQDKQTYLRCIADGTLNYYSAEHENLDVSINADSAVLTGQSKVTAAVFGGGRHTWNLQLRFWLIKQDGIWLQYKSQASTY